MESNEWYLLKVADHETFGPASIDELRDWALSAKVSPMDKVSNDGMKSWVRAPMVSDLHMDWLVELADDYLYGPTTVGAIQEFMRNGEIDGDTTLINCREGNRTTVNENPALATLFAKRSEDEAAADAAISGDLPPASLGTQKRILELENLVLQLRRELNRSERRFQELREKYTEKTGEHV
ncbi:MAG: GYF domain-containing protein [Verrucomicrobiales bacterium]